MRMSPRSIALMLSLSKVWNQHIRVQLLIKTLAVSGSMAIEGLTCGQLTPDEKGPSNVHSALRATLATASDVSIESVEIGADCGRRAMQLVLQFKLSVSSDAFASSSVNSLSSSISSGEFGDTFGDEALKRGETAALSASGFSSSTFSGLFAGVHILILFAL